MSKVVTNWWNATDDRPLTQYEAAEFNASDAINDLEENGAWLTKDANGSILLHHQNDTVPIDDDKALRRFLRKRGYLPKGSRMHKVTLDVFRQYVDQGGIDGDLRVRMP
jgi:hypothetical protein